METNFDYLKKEKNHEYQKNSKRYPPGVDDLFRGRVFRIGQRDKGKRNRGSGCEHMDD